MNDMKYDQMTLGELIRGLEKICASESGRSTRIMYTFGDFKPDSLHSFRGDYSELALGFMDVTLSYGNSAPMTADALLGICKDAVDQIFEGYKGGYYKMESSTPIWVAARHSSTQVMLVGLSNPKCNQAFLLTRHIDITPETSTL